MRGPLHSVFQILPMPYQIALTGGWISRVKLIRICPVCQKQCGLFYSDEMSFPTQDLAERHAVNIGLKALAGECHTLFQQTFSCH